MGGRFRNLRITALVVVLGLVLAACSGGDNNKTAATSKQTTTTDSGGGTTSTFADTPPSTGPVTTAKGSATTAKVAPTTQAAAPPTTTNPNAPPAPAQQGTYDYAQSGSTSQGPVPPKGTLEVKGAGPSQVFRRYFDPEESPSDINFVFRNDGPFITSIVVRQGPATMNCSFRSPVPAPPWPPHDGRTFSGRATCGNGFTADFAGSITGHKDDDVGGKSVEVIVIESTLHIVGNGIDVNVKDTQYWAPSLRVPTFSREVISGTAFDQPVAGDVTSKLTSTTPH